MGKLSAYDKCLIKIFLKQYSRTLDNHEHLKKQVDDLIEKIKHW